MTNKGIRCEQRIHSIIKRLSKFMSESLQITLYSRMYRDMLINEIKILEYGDSAMKIMRENENLATASLAIRLEVKGILDKEPAFRSATENLFICGMMRQKNGVFDRLTKGWPAHQYNGLCKSLKFLRVKPMKRVSII